MRCIWSAAASSVLRPSARTLVFNPSRKFSQCPSNKSLKTRYFSPNPSIRRLAHTAALPAPVVAQQFHPIPSDLSDAQASRAACQVVRVFCKHGELRNAYFVVNSLRSSDLSPAFSQPQSPPNDSLNNLLNDYDILDFGRRISPRLACHALLHGLLRVGLTRKAGKLAEMMMEDGIRLHSRSLEAVVRAMGDTATANVSSNFRPAMTLFRGHFNRKANILDIAPKKIQDPCLSFAVRVVLQARNYRQRRTKDMFDAVIKACILQGEIIVGSLLFILAVKDWQLRSAASALVATSQTHVAEDTAPFPPQSSMLALLSNIENGIIRHAAQDDESSRTIIGAYLQSLANIASLLDQRQLPFSQIAPLIRVLMQCPQLDYDVWIDRKGTRIKLNAYEYFHTVLGNLARDLPSSKKKRRKESDTVLPPLDRHSYNALLHYALRHRLSVPMATQILHHMKDDRWLHPDISTYNIILRAGTLMRKNHVTEAVLTQLRLRLAQPPVADRTNVAETCDWLEPLEGIDSSAIKLEAVPQISNAEVVPDEYTLSSYITHLTSTGQPNAVAELLFRLIPELVIIQHPSWGNLSKEERQEIKAQSRATALHRAVNYGPYLFTTVLNALTKAGRTGLAERVWFLAKEAERASWSGAFASGEHPVQPWCLPVQAYTCMLQCYADETHKSLLLRKRRTLKDPGQVEDALNDGNDWQVTAMSKRYTRGWARFVAFRNSVQNKGAKLTRSQAAHLMSIELANSMRDGAQQVFSAMTAMHPETLSQMFESRALAKRVQVPQPDARFFNAALEVFNRYEGMRMRRARNISRAHWQRHSRTTEGWYARFWIMSKQWHPFLQVLAERMHEAGYSVPQGFRHLFLGRYTPATQTLVHDRTHLLLQSTVRPYKFSKRVKAKFRPFTIPTVKERGLPVRRVRQRSRFSRRAL